MSASFSYPARSPATGQEGRAVFIGVEATRVSRFSILIEIGGWIAWSRNKIPASFRWISTVFLFTLQDLGFSCSVASKRGGGRSVDGASFQWSRSWHAVLTAPRHLFVFKQQGSGAADAVAVSLLPQYDV